MEKYILLFLLPLLVLGCTPKPVVADAIPELREDEPFAYQDYWPEDVQRPETYEFIKERKPNPEHYFPDTTNERYLPIRYLQLNFHIMNTSDTLFPFYGEKARKYVKEVVFYANELIRKTPEIWLQPDSIDVPALSRRLGFNLAKIPGTDEHAIYEHYDDELYWYLHDGRKRNRASREVINKYAVRKDSILNIFVMGPPRDSVLSKSFRLSGVDGIYLGDAIKMTGWLSRDRPSWEMRNVLAHEIGHALGLGHAWTRNDGCDDTPVHANRSWSVASGQRGPGKTSNNLMDYSPKEESLTPCQIGRMHARMSDITGRQRKWLLPYWCRYNPNEPVRVTKDLNWEGARDFNTDIFVRRGSTLRINNRLHLPEGAAIHVDPGARLLIGPAAVIHSDCGGQWAGIRRGVTDSGIGGEIVIDPAATFLNEQI